MAKSDPNLLTQAEYARSRKDRGLPGGSREAVRRAVDEGRISAFGPDKLLDQALADSQWARNTRARVGAGSGEPDLLDGDHDASEAPAPASTSSASRGDATYMALRARREAADAERAEMETAKLRGSMLMRDDVDRAMFEIGRELRDALMGCGRRIASEVASLTSAEACEHVLDREHRIVLQLLATAFREKIGAAGKGPGA